MSERGFIFTIDALLAIAIVVGAGFALFMIVQKTDSEIYSLQLSRVKADDNAMVGFYFGKSTSADQLDFFAEKQEAYCTARFNYVKDSEGGHFSDINYCEGK